MSTLPDHLPLPLAGFVSRLRAAGFVVDASREFQLRRVLHEQGANYLGRFDELKYALAPYVATNAAEQRRLYQLWEDYVRELEQKLEEAPPSDTAGEVKRRNVTTYLLLAVAGLLLGWYLFNFFSKPTPPPHQPILVELKQDAEARAGQPLQVRNATLLEHAYDSSRFSWQFADAATGETLATADAVFNYDFTIPDKMEGRQLRVVLSIAALADRRDSILADSLVLSVLCRQAPYVEGISLPEGDVRKDDESTFSLLGKAEDGVEYLWLVAGDTLAGPQVQYEFLTEGQTTVQLLARRMDSPEYCYTLLPPQKIQVGSDLPVFPIIPLKKDIERQLLVANGLLYLLPLLFGLFGYFLIRRYWQNRTEQKREKTDEELAAEYPFYDEGPYVIPYRDQSGQISVPADFFRIADQLRIREAGHRMVFDGRATVEATIREGGFPSWQERAIKRPANYLVLLRHTDEFHQQDRLLKRLTDFLLVREAALEVYYHGGDFSWFWNEAFPKGWSPSQLKGRYGEYRLIIMGDGHGLLDAFHRGDPRLLPTKERWFHGWARRLLLTTEPVADWSFQEVLLHRHSLLYPITTDGILRGVADLNVVEEYQCGAFPRWKAERLRRDPEPSYRYRTWTTIGDHEAYLEDDPDLFRWLTALATIPNPDWSLTIAIGRALGLAVTHDRLLRLSRIPWLAANSPDQDLRLAFLERLSFEDEQLARAAALEQLEIVSAEVTNTFAASEWTANQAVQSFALAPNDPTHKETIRDLRRMGLLAPDQLAELNLVAERQFPAQKMRQQSAAGDPLYLDRLLEPAEEPKAILSEREKQLLGLIVACLLLCLPMFLYNRGEHELPSGQEAAWWQEIENPTDAAHLALEKNNAAVFSAEMIARAKNYTEFTQRQGVLDRRIAAALDSALLLRNGAYPLADSNRTAYLLNQKAYALNWTVADSLKGLPGQQSNVSISLTALTDGMVQKYSVTDPYTLQALHMEGIYAWWNFQQVYPDAEDKESAIDRFKRAADIKRRIDELDGWYFNSLKDSMPVNLAYLLRRDSSRIARDLREPVDFKGLKVTGKVVNTAGKPLPGAAVLVQGTRTAVVTDIRGNFSLDMPLSLGYITVSFGGVEEELDVLSPTGAIPGNGNLGTIRLDASIATPASPTITGRVVDGNDRPLAGITVILQNLNRKVVTQTNGRFSFSPDDPITNIKLSFASDGFERLVTFRWSDNQGALGDITFYAEEQAPLATYDINGRVVNDKGLPLAGVNVVLEGTNVRTRTNTDGTFNVDVANADQKYTLIFSAGSATVSKTVAYRDSRDGNMVDVVLKEVSEDDDLGVIQELQSFGTYRYAKLAEVQGSEEESLDFVQRLVSRLEGRRIVQGLVTGDQLIAGVPAISNLERHNSYGKFLFVDNSRRAGRAADLVTALHQGSKALVINDQILPANDGASAATVAALRREVSKLSAALRSNGFEVTELNDPTNEEIAIAIDRLTQLTYRKGDQLFIYLGGDNFNDFFQVDKEGVGITGGGEYYEHPALNSLTVAPHLLIIKNYANTLAPPIQVPAQEPGKLPLQQRGVGLINSGVTSGTLGISVSSKPIFSYRSEQAGSVTYEVCINNEGRVTSAVYTQKGSSLNDPALLNAVSSNIREWRFTVKPLIQPAKECGRVTFVFR